LQKKHWLEIPNHYSNVILDEFIIMPNHIHGIITIVGNNVGTEQCSVVKNNDFNNVGTEQCSVVKNNDFNNVGTEQCSVPTGNKINKNYGLLSKIIKSFKEIVVKKIHTKYGFNFQWQRSFYDHIIRNEKSLNNIRDYIISNPGMWNRDGTVATVPYKKSNIIPDESVINEIITIIDTFL